jgi:hypothetical protein
MKGELGGVDDPEFFVELKFEVLELLILFIDF